VIMKYAVIAQLYFDTPAKKDKMTDEVKAFIVNKVMWGVLVNASGLTEKDESTNTISIRFDNEADMDNLYALIKDRMEKIPVLKGSVSKHPCSHDESSPHPCVISEEFIKE